MPARPRFEGQAAAVQLGDRAADVDPHAHALLLGGEEGLEQPRGGSAGMPAPRSATVTVTKGPRARCAGDDALGWRVSRIESIAIAPGLTTICSIITTASAGHLRQGRRQGSLWIRMPRLRVGLDQADGVADHRGEVERLRLGSGGARNRAPGG